MRSVVIPRPERALLLVNSMANLLRALLVLCLCQATAALARGPSHVHLPGTDRLNTGIEILGNSRPSNARQAARRPKT